MKFPLDAELYKKGHKLYQASKMYEQLSCRSSSKEAEVVAYVWEKLTKNAKELHSINQNKMNSFLNLEKRLLSTPLAKLDWNDICNDIQQNPKNAISYHLLVYYILSNDLYQGSHKNKLLTLIDIFKLKPYKKAYTLKLYCCDDVERLFYDSRSSALKLLKLPKECNQLTLKLLSDFWLQTLNQSNDYMEFYNLFPLSIKGLNIDSASDYSYATWKTQTNFYAKKAADSKHCLENLNRYYLFINNIVSDKNGVGIFNQSDPIDTVILSRDHFAKYTLEGYSYIYFNPFTHYPSSDKWMLNFNGYEEKSTKLSSNNIRSFDFKKVIDPFYRDCLKDFIWNSHLSPSVMNDNSFRLAYLLNFIYKMKSIKDYPNPDFSNFNFYEADQIKAYIAETKGEGGTGNSYLSYLKMFIRYCVQNRNFVIDKYFYKHLIAFQGNHLNTAKAIPDEDLAKLNDILRKHQYESEVKTFYYAIFHICLQTSLRISQICHLNYDCLSNTMKNGQYKIKTVSKTSNGEKYKTIISKETGKQIKDIIKLTDENRQNCKDSKLAKYLFLKKDQMEGLGYSPVRPANFKKYLYECCDEVNIPKYGPSNLRDTHITKAFEYRLRNGMSDAAQEILTGHPNLNTDASHYIQENLIQMLETTYGIIIGDVDIKGKIVSEEDNSIQQKYSVENGTGYCEARNCVLETTLPCLYCKEFITTVQHKPYFIAMMNQVDDKLKEVDKTVDPDKQQHRKDDLLAIKELIARYIYHINLIEEGLEDEHINESRQ